MLVPEMHAGALQACVRLESGRFQSRRWKGTELTPGKRQLEFDFKYDGLRAGTKVFCDYRAVGQRPDRRAEGRRQHRCD
jgi:hypothetical protein